MTLPAIALLLVLAPLGAQDTVTLVKTFRVGDKERFATKLSMSVPFGEVDMDLKTEQRVLKTFEEGGAELESELLSMEVRINGEKSDLGPPEAGRKAKFKVDASGMPLQTDAQAGFGFNFLQFVGLIGDKPLIKGKPVAVNWSDPAQPKRKALGKIILEGIEDGLARLISNWEIFLPSQEKPLKIDMTSLVEISTGKLRKASGTITGAPSPNVEIKAIQFSMEAVGT